jgi:hypothetical protein
MRHRSGQQPESCHEHRHHDGTEPQHGAFNSGIHNRVAPSPQLVDVFEHDDARLNGYAEKRQETNS